MSDGRVAAGALRVFETRFDARLLEETREPYAVVLRAGARLTPDALEIIEGTLLRFPETTLLYGDDTGTARPAFSPVRLRSQDYLGGVVVLAADAAREALSRLSGALAAGLPTGDALVWLIALQLAEQGAPGVAVPQPLTVPADDAAGVPASADDARRVQELLGANGVESSVSVAAGGVLDIRYPVGEAPLVSIVMPTRGGSGSVHGRERCFVVEAVRSILEKSTYPRLEIVVVADADTPPEVEAELALIAGDRLRLIRWSAPFNFAAKMNRGALEASGEYLLLLNDDVEVLSADWIERMLGLALQKRVGLVGALLLFEDGTVQHGGHLYRRGEPTHAAIGVPRDDPGPGGSLLVDREVSGVTAACALLSAERFREVGGFSALLPSNYNDVDLCLKLGSRGLSVLWTPHAVLHHYESRSRVARIVPYERQLLLRRWASRIQVDPFWPER
ncbi:glycosyltransferase family 2 protein [Leifsonia sp. AG29]|uniref:glycosyltransferase family 2 protein n=1 Tax=Leifsonia sp. AG29 TaxID=2598860 RepID=UPI00131D4CDC|nr:glycosyltransferase [Leifsonia sp. AG29]